MADAVSMGARRNASDDFDGVPPALEANRLLQRDVRERLLLLQAEAVALVAVLNALTHAAADAHFGDTGVATLGYQPRSAAFSPSWTRQLKRRRLGGGGGVDRCAAVAPTADAILVARVLVEFPIPAFERGLTPIDEAVLRGLVARYVRAAGRPPSVFGTPQLWDAISWCISRRKRAYLSSGHRPVAPMTCALHWLHRVATLTSQGGPRHATATHHAAVSERRGRQQVEAAEDDGDGQEDDGHRRWQLSWSTEDERRLIEAVAAQLIEQSARESWQSAVCPVRALLRKVATVSQVVAGEERSRCDVAAVPLVCQLASLAPTSLRNGIARMIRWEEVVERLVAGRPASGGRHSLFEVVAHWRRHPRLEQAMMTWLLAAVTQRRVATTVAQPTSFLGPPRRAAEVGGVRVLVLGIADHNADAAGGPPETRVVTLPQLAAHHVARSDEGFCRRDAMFLRAIRLAASQPGSFGSGRIALLLDEAGFDNVSVHDVTSAMTRMHCGHNSTSSLGTDDAAATLRKPLGRTQRRPPSLDSLPIHGCVALLFAAFGNAASLLLTFAPHAAVVQRGLAWHRRHDASVGSHQVHRTETIRDSQSAVPPSVLAAARNTHPADDVAGRGMDLLHDMCRATIRKACIACVETPCLRAFKRGRLQSGLPVAPMTACPLALWPGRLFSATANRLARHAGGVASQASAAPHPARWSPADIALTCDPAILMATEACNPQRAPGGEVVLLPAITPQSDEAKDALRGALLQLLTVAADTHDPDPDGATASWSAATETEVVVATAVALFGKVLPRLS